MQIYMERYIFIKEAWDFSALAKMGEIQTAPLNGDFFTSCQEEWITDKTAMRMGIGYLLAI